MEAIIHLLLFPLFQIRPGYVLLFQPILGFTPVDISQFDSLLDFGILWDLALRLGRRRQRFDQRWRGKDRKGNSTPLLLQNVHGKLHTSG